MAINTVTETGSNLHRLFPAVVTTAWSGGFRKSRLPAPAGDLSGATIQRGTKNYPFFRFQTPFRHRRRPHAIRRSRLSQPFSDSESRRRRRNEVILWQTKKDH